MSFSPHFLAQKTFPQNSLLIGFSISRNLLKQSIVDSQKNTIKLSLNLARMYGALYSFSDSSVPI